MSTERKLLIGAGALLLVLMTGIIAFSLGVYVGSKGWLTQPTITAQRANTAAVQQDRVQAEPAEQPALTGLLVNGNRTVLTLRTQDGPRQVEIDEDVVVMRWDGEIMALGDLRRGMALAVFGEFDEDGRVLHAQRIVRLPVSRDADATTD